MEILVFSKKEVPAPRQNQDGAKECVVIAIDFALLLFIKIQSIEVQQNVFNEKLYVFMQLNIKAKGCF